MRQKAAEAAANFPGGKSGESGGARSADGEALLLAMFFQTHRHTRHRLMM